MVGPPEKSCKLWDSTRSSARRIASGSAITKTAKLLGQPLDTPCQLYYCVNTIFIAAAARLPLPTASGGIPVQIRISQHDGVPFYLQIVRQVKYLVASGRLHAGDQLPPVRKLAEQLIVNPNTVARAYRELETEGVVNTRRGAGVFVSDAGSPLAKREQKRILAARVDSLLTEARQMDVALEALIDLVRERSRRIEGEH